jgi:uncharacterized protein YndB with AHSA1/START domain
MQLIHRTKPRANRRSNFWKRCIPLILFASAGIAGTAGAAEVSRETTIDAKATEVWRAIGPYCSIADWYPGIETCTEENINGALRRRLRTADGGEFLEEQLNHSDQAMRYTYAIVEGPLPVSDYEATLSVSESGGKTVVVWSGTFAPKGVSEEEATNIVGGIYETGLKAVKERFAN